MDPACNESVEAGDGARPPPPPKSAVLFEELEVKDAIKALLSDRLLRLVQETGRRTDGRLPEEVPAGEAYWLLLIWTVQRLRSVSRHCRRSHPSTLQTETVQRLSLGYIRYAGVFGILRI